MVEMNSINSNLRAKMCRYSSNLPHYHLGILNLSKICIRLEPSEWLHYFRLAHSYRKLSRPPPLVLDLYVKSLLLATTDSGHREYDCSLEIVYKATSFILKECVSKSIDEREACILLSKLLECHHNVRNFLLAKSTLVSEDNPVATIILILQAITNLDKKRWIHKPYFRLAWIYATINNDSTKAKDEMIAFLNIKSKGGIRRIWKTELEL